MEDYQSPTHINRTGSICRSNSTPSVFALNKLSSLQDKIFQGEYSPRNIPLSTDPSIDSKTAFKVAISTCFFMLGLHLKQKELYSLTIIKVLWLLALFSFSYLFPPKSLKSLQQQLSCFIVFRFFSSSIIYSLVVGPCFSYEFHVHSQEYDILVNLFLVLIIALLVQKEVTIWKKYLLGQFLSYIFISGALQLWFNIFDYIALLTQITLFISFVTYSKLMHARSNMDRELVKATISKHCEDISQELIEIRNKLEEETQAVTSNSLNTSKVDELVMKIKYFKFALLQKEKEKSFLNARPIYTNARRRTYMSRGTEPSGPYAYVEKRNDEPLFSCGSLSDIKSSPNGNISNNKNDINARWTLSSDDCDILVKIILEKQVFLWYPEVLKTQDSRVCKESAEFLKQHFTEIGNSLFRTNSNSESKQSLWIDPKAFGCSPWGSYLDTNICSWNFDMLKFKELTNGNHFAEFGSAMIKKFNILKTLNISPNTMTNFLRDVSDAYLPNAYHNSIHGADVCNSVGYFLVNQEFGKHFNELEVSCLIISALVHDLGHPGLNNAFLVNTRSTEALIYNDQSVLENFHTASFFKILKKSSSNILENLSEKDYKLFRKLAINLILDTDLTKHFIILSKFKNNPDALNFAEENDRFLTLSIALKCADVAHGAKELNLHKRWSRRIIEEFFYQGDKEREYNIPVSPLCDRTGNISKSQHGFLNFIVLPLFEAVDQKIFNEEMRETVTNQIRKNIKYWEEEIPKETEGECNFMKETEKVLEDVTEEAATGK